MNRKKAMWVIVVVLLVLAAVALWLFLRLKADVPIDQSGSECLLFQSSDPTAPCYIQSGGSVGPGGPGPSTGTGTEPVIPGPVATTSAALPARCSGEASIIDRNECVSVYAVEIRQTGVCDAIVGSLAKASCMNGVTQKPLVLPAAPTSYQDFIEIFTRTPSVAGTASQIVKSPTSVPDFQVAESDSRFTAEGFVERYTAGADLAIYALSQYQAKPGETVYVYGSGFVYPSTVMVGSTVISGLRSDDGASLSFTAPSSTGEYEISVSNSKGTSGGNRPKLVVTGDPIPRPQITGATPSIVSVDGEVVLTGIGFLANNVVATTLGALTNVSSSGNSIRFKISNLPVVSQVKDLPEVKGKKFGVGVYISNENGFNKDLFYFDVQF